MTTAINDLIGVGWDVRGWQSRKQATAVARFRRESKQIEWLGVSELFRFTVGSAPGFIELAEPAVGLELAQQLFSHEHITIAIDAPLSFPISFQHLIEGKAKELSVPEREIENKLAYRDCERWVKEHYNKKPLSAPFDKLGNNASLAISVAQNLEKQHFMKVPQTSLQSKRAVIEVYPGLVKTGTERILPAIPELEKYIPKSLEVGTDQYDAAICALLALLFQGVGSYIDLPELVPIHEGFNSVEGWIYTFPLTI